MSPVAVHLFGDGKLYAAFAFGQLLFILKRADMVARSKVNGVGSKMHYFELNWVPLLIRVVLEACVIFYGWRHYSLPDLAGLVGWTPPTWLSLPQVPVVALILGFMSDSALDWLSTWNRLPAFIREQIPPLNGYTEKTSTSKSTVTDGQTKVESTVETKQTTLVTKSPDPSNT